MLFFFKFFKYPDHPLRIDLGGQYHLHPFRIRLRLQLSAVTQKFQHAARL